MMDDYNVLKFLGLEIKDNNTIVFYDDDSNEHFIEFSEILSFSFDKASIPLENKMGFWLENLYVHRSVLGIVSTQKNAKDYRDIYELEIELINNRVLSRRVEGADIVEIREFINEINQLITNTTS